MEAPEERPDDTRINVGGELALGPYRILIVGADKGTARLRWTESKSELEEMRAKLSAIEAHCRKYAHPGCNAETHRVCREMLRVIEG